MKGTRSSLRLRENFKNKFTNIVDTTLDLEDGDFVNPPKGAHIVNEGQPLEGVIHEEQNAMPKILYQPILIESTTIKKRKAKNVGSSPKVRQKSVAQRVIDQMREVRSKRKFEKAHFTTQAKRITEIVRKVDKTYGPGLRRLPSRMTLIRITMAVKTLSESQKKRGVCGNFGACIRQDFNRKNNMEVALQEGLAKHPNFPELLERVFFSIVDKQVYNLLCFDFRKPSYVIIHHLKRKGSNPKAY
ncbi:hypothetical protein L1887_31879 [Cichorium endivia]|nr:hypothetical protein L1887_31879 [Cichorium endivia]